MKNKPDEKSDVTIAKNASLIFAGSSITILLKLAISIVITRSLGPGYFGIYILAIALLTFTETLALFGFENSIVKHVSQYNALKDLARVKGAITLGIVCTQTLCVAVGISAFFISPFISNNIFHKPDLLLALKIIIIALPFRCLCRINLATLQGLKLIRYKVYISQLLVPCTRLLFVSVAALNNFGLTGVVCSFVLSEILGTLFSIYYLLKNVPFVYRLSTAVIEFRKITFFALPLMFAEFFRILMQRADTMIIGYFLSAEFVGIYGTAKRIVPVIAFPLNAFNSIFSPIISDLYAKNELNELRRQFKNVARWIFSFSLPLFAFIVIFSEAILGVFGDAFVTGKTVLILLSIGQMASTATGSVGFMLTMTGRPIINALNAFTVCAMSILLNIFLIPIFGVIGAAYTGMISLLLTQLLRLSEVWYFLRIHPYRIDFLKPILSGIVTIVITHMINLKVAQLIIGIHWLPIFFCIFVSVYIGVIFLLKLSPEDYIVIDFLKQKILKPSV